MSVRLEILEDGCIEMLNHSDGKTYFTRYRDLAPALARAKELLAEEQRVARTELTYQRKESKGLYSSPRFVEGE